MGTQSRPHGQGASHLSDSLSPRRYAPNLVFCTLIGIGGGEEGGRGREGSDGDGGGTRGEMQHTTNELQRGGELQPVASWT